jgi:hypothetical protein
MNIYSKLKLYTLMNFEGMYQVTVCECVEPYI